MRIINKDLRKGYVEVIPENEDDLWILYNVIEQGDVVKARTTREVKFGEKGSSRRIPMIVSIRVENLEFQPFTDRLRIRGVVVDAPEEFGIKGKHHTLNISPGTRLIISKNKWFDHQLKRIEESSKTQARVVVVVMDYDEACIALVSEQGVKVIDEIRSGMPGKYYSVDASSYVKKYVEKIAKRIVDVVKRYGVKVVVVASPGDVSKLVADLVKDKVEKVFRDSVSIGGCSGLNEVLRRDSVKKAVEELSIVRAQEILNEFKLLLIKKPDMVAYGLDDVEYAVKHNAVKKMVVSSDMIQSYDEEMRARITNLLEEAYKKRADIVIVPYNSDVGREVSSMGGIIAVLRFQLYRPVNTGV